MKVNFYFKVTTFLYCDHMKVMIVVTKVGEYDVLTCMCK